MEKRHGAAKVMGSMPPPEKLPQSEGPRKRLLAVVLRTTVLYPEHDVVQASAPACLEALAGAASEAGGGHSARFCPTALACARQRLRSRPQQTRAQEHRQEDHGATKQVICCDESRENDAGWELVTACLGSAAAARLSASAALESRR